jgi:16S rRNA (cytosine967-C5)-methyltransferase
MNPGARVQAAIDVLYAVIAAVRAGGAPADRVLADWFKPRRFAGSGDRRAVRDLVYAAIRACGEVPETGRSAMLRVAQGDPAIAALFDGSRHGPEPIRDGEAVATGGVAPLWLAGRLAASGIDGVEARALLERAPLDVRINPLREGAVALPDGGVPTIAPHGLRFAPGTAIEQSAAHQAGLIEVQDAGSQLAAHAVGARGGEVVIDLCAGAGGKTLALAADMANHGTLIACDTDRTRLSRLAPRAERAGVRISETILLDPAREAQALASWAGKADAVLVDAPCSGTGTWRRNPEARWRLTPAQLDRYTAVQSHLLDVAAGLLAPFGRLIFVTCSLLDAEGADQVSAFLARHPDFRAEPPGLPAGRPRGQGWRLTPSHDETDGFFIARLSRSC